MSHKRKRKIGDGAFSRRLGGAVGAALALGLLAACQPAAEPPKMVEVPKPVEVQVPKCDLPSLDSGRKFVVEAWPVPDATLDIGEPLRLQMRVSSRSYMSVFHVSTSCKVTRLLEDHPMEAAQIVNFPLRDSGIEMIVKPPTGREGFYFVASRQKLAFLSPADILRDTGGIASLDLSPAQFYARVRDDRSRMDPDDWTIKTLRLPVVAH